MNQQIQISEEDELRKSFNVQKYLKRLKKYVFQIYLEVGSCNITNQLLLKALILLEMIQLLYFTIHDSFEVSNSSIIDGFRDAIKYLQFNTLINEGNNSVNNFLLYFSFASVFIPLVLFIFLVVKMHKMECRNEKVLPGVYKQMVKSFCFFSNLLNTVLLIPFINIFMVNLLCLSNSPANKEKSCYSSNEISSISLSFIGMIITLSIVKLSSTFIINLNPFSDVSYSGQYSNIMIVKNMLKGLIVCYQIIDYNGMYWKSFIVVLTLFYGLILSKRYQIVSYYNESLHNFIMSVECIVFWITLCISFQGQADEQNSISNKELVYVLVFIPVILLTWYKIICHRNEQYLQFDLKELRKPEDAEKQLLILINLIDNRQSNSEYKVLLEGFIRMHSIDCKVQDCQCRIITDTALQRNIQRQHQAILEKEKREEQFEEFKKLNVHLKQEDLETAFEQSIQNKMQASSTYQSQTHLQEIEEEQFDESNEEKMTKNWYLFLSNQIKISQDLQKSSKICILDASIQFYRLENTFLSLKKLMGCENLKPKIFEQFAILQSKESIEEAIISEKKLNERNKNSINLSQALDYEYEFTLLKRIISFSLDYSNDFWAELLDKNPDVQKLQILGTQITSSLEEIEKQYETLYKINEKSIKAIYYYAFFIKDVINDEDMFMKYLEKMEYVMRANENNAYQQDEMQKLLGENSKCGIVQISGNLLNRYSVLRVNNDMNRIYQFSQKDLAGQNVKSRIMPRVYSQIHNQLIDHYMDTSRPAILGYESLVFPINKEGYLVPSKMLVNAIFSMTEGLQFVSLIKNIDDLYMKPYKTSEGEGFQEYEDDHYLIYKSGLFQNIVGITKSVQEQFGIHQDLTNDNTTMAKEFTLDLICSQVNDKLVQQQMLSDKGATITIDTFIVKQQYLLSGDDDTNQQKSSTNNNNNDDNQNSQNKQDQEDPNNVSQNAQMKSNLSNFDLEYKEDQQQLLQDELLQEQRIEDLNNNINYKKSQINIKIVQQFVRFGIQLNVAKFTEVHPEDQEHDLEEQKAKQKINDLQKDIEKQNSHIIDMQSMEERENDSQIEKALQNIGESQSQNLDKNLRSSVINSAEDLEEKQAKELQEMRALIQEKTVPKFIKLLKRMMILYLLFTFGIISYILNMRLDQFDTVQMGISIIQNAYVRHSLMATINQRVLDLNLLSNKFNSQYLQYNDEMQRFNKDLRKMLTDDIQEFQDVHYEIISQMISTSEQLNSNIDLQDVTLQDLLSNQKTVSQTITLNQGMEKIISSAAALSKYDDVKLFSDSQNTETFASDSAIYQYFIGENGLFTLRVASERLADIIFYMYINSFDNFQQTLLGIIISSCFIILFSQVCFLPIVLKVYKANTSVITLFSFIPLEQVQELVAKIQFYNLNFIINHNEADQNSIGSYEEGKAFNHQSQDEQKQNNEEEQQPKIIEETKQVSQATKSGQKKDVNFEQQTQEDTAIPNALIGAQNENNQDSKNNKQEEDQNQENNNVQKKQKKKKKQKKNVFEGMEEEEMAALRSERLMATVQNKRNYIILQFSFFSLILIAYFVFDFIYELDQVSQIKSVYQHIRNINMKSSIVKYRTLSTQLYIISDESRFQTIMDKYQEDIYDNDQDTDTNFLESFPSAYSEYREKFIKINQSNICENAFPDFTQEESQSCLDVNNQILKQGLKQAITTMNEMSRDIIIKYKVERRKTHDVDFYFQETKKKFLNSNVIQSQKTMVNYIADANDYIRENINTASETYTTSQSQNEQIKFILVFITLCLGFIFVWMPYLESLNRKIWMTKGILSMIPQRTILQNRILLDQFMNGDTFKAVR